MENAFVISGLKAKRAELFTALRETEKQATLIRAQIATLDATAKLFDPELALPTVKRGPTHSGRRTGITRAIMGTLREAREPMTCRQIAETTAAAMSVRADVPKDLNNLVYRVRAS